VDAKKNQSHTVTRLLESTDQAWTSDSLQIQPDFRAHGKLGFPVGADRGKQLLAVAVEGRFESYFKGKPSPLAADDESAQKTASSKPGSGVEKSTKETSSVISREIDRSPESARIILFGSNSFLSDKLLQLASSGLGTRYLNPVQLVENAVDWSLEDRGLLTIRGRSQYLRTLEPLDRNTEVFWEYLNYALALLGLLAVWAIRALVNRRARRRYTALLGTA
jgi:ABC-2 type transport system permease protein